mgnify:FL=1
MKDSGIEWIGEVPERWETQKLKYYATVTSGEILSKDEYVFSGDIPVIGSNGKIGTTYKSNNHSEVITTGRVGTIGTAQIVQDAWITDNALIIKSHSISRPFLTYVIPNFDFKFMLSGTAQPLITATKLKNQYIPVPSSDVQDKLVQYLNTQIFNLSHLISQVCSSIELYKKFKQAVITQAVTKGVRGEREMKDSGVEWIGEINHRFSLIKLKYICSILDQYRKPISADKRSQSGSILYDYYGASGAIDKIDDYTIDDHVMLIGEDGANLRMRNLPLMYEVNGKAWINNHAHILKPTERVDFYYLFYALEELDINPYITGSAQPKLSQEKLQNIWVPLPDFEEQQEIATYIRSKCAEIDGVIAKKELLVKELESYKKSLIYEVVTGKREV